MSVPEISVGDLAQRIAAGQPVVDVRQPEEYVEAHVPGAILVPLGEVADRVLEIASLGAVNVICRSGARSLRAAEFLRAQGIDATNVAGGTLAWVSAGYAAVAGEQRG